MIIRPAAYADIEDAYGWYERQRRGLGAEFELCVEEALAKIRRNPELYPKVHKNMRRALIRRFPYGVFYAVRNSEIVVVGVFHGRRDPRIWQGRS